METITKLDMSNSADQFKAEMMLQTDPWSITVGIRPQDGTAVLVQAGNDSRHRCKIYFSDSEHMRQISKALNMFADRWDSGEFQPHVQGEPPNGNRNEEATQEETQAGLPQRDEAADDQGTRQRG